MDHFKFLISQIILNNQTVDKIQLLFQ
jgi:hypothetical protein